MNIPMVLASASQDPFPDITFYAFSKIVAELFSSKVSLATVLSVLFTMTANNDLLNLHARQQNPQRMEEKHNYLTGWITALSRAVQEKLGERADTLFRQKEDRNSLSHIQVTTTIATKLDTLAKGLHLSPYNNQGHLIKRLDSISDESIQPALVVCPKSVECEQATCQKGSLYQESRDRDIPRVTLIKGTQLICGVQVLVAKCARCKTSYHADHQRILHSSRTDSWNRAYLNNATYLKIGQAVWVDRNFSKAVLNGIYNFHASSSAYAQFWNESFWEIQETSAPRISHRQVWQAFVQESVRKMAQLSKVDLLLSDGLPIAEVTKHAFRLLGSKGIIKCAEDHSCTECTHEYKATADTIRREDARQDPAALLGVDEHQDVPLLQGENADLAAQDAAIARATQIGLEIEDVEMQGSDESSAASSDEPSNDFAPIKMVVLDGIVMGHTVCHIIVVFISDNLH